VPERDLILDPLPKTFSTFALYDKVRSDKIFRRGSSSPLNKYLGNIFGHLKELRH